MTTITTRTDLVTWIHNCRADITALGDRYVQAVCDQIQASDHPAWGEDWTEWLAETLDDTFVETVVDGVDALEGGLSFTTAATIAAAYDVGFEPDTDSPAHVTADSLPMGQAQSLATQLREAGASEVSVAPDCDDDSLAWVYVTLTARQELEWARALASEWGDSSIETRALTLIG